MCNPTPHPDLELGSSSHAEEEEFTLFVPKPQQSSSPSPSKIRDAPPTDSGFASKLLDGVSPAQQMMILSFAMVCARSRLLHDGNDGFLRDSANDCFRHSSCSSGRTTSYRRR